MEASFLKTKGFFLADHLKIQKDAEQSKVYFSTILESPLFTSHSIPVMCRARILASLWLNKNFTKESELYTKFGCVPSKKNSFDAEVLLKALQLLDAKRKAHKLQSTIDQMGPDKARSPRAKILINQLKSLKKEVVEDSGSLSGALIKHIRNWVRNLGAEDLKEYNVMKYGLIWRGIAKHIHFKEKDFKDAQFYSQCITNAQAQKSSNREELQKRIEKNKLNNKDGVAVKPKKKVKPTKKEKQPQETIPGAPIESPASDVPDNGPSLSDFLGPRPYVPFFGENTSLAPIIEPKVPQVSVVHQEQNEPPKKIKGIPFVINTPVQSIEDDPSFEKYYLDPESDFNTRRNSIKLQDLEPNAEDNIPFIVRADVGDIQTDILTIKVGANLMGFLGGKIESYYGPKIMTYLRSKWGIPKVQGNAKKGGVGPNGGFAELQQIPQLTSNMPIYRQGKKALGLQPGLSTWLPQEELRQLPGANPTAPPLVLTVIGVKGLIPVTVKSTKLNMVSIFECLRKYNPDNSVRKVVAIPAFCFGSGKLKIDEERIGILSCQIECLIEFRKIYPQFIPVLVTYSDALQRLAILARNKVIGSTIPRMFQSNDEMAHVSKLQAELVSNRITFFIGAGVSLASNVPSWGVLVNRLREKAGLPPTEDNETKSLLRGAEEARSLLGIRFGDSLKECLGFGGKFIPHPSLTHYLLAGLPNHNIVTTNYDPLMENTLQNLKKATFTISSPAEVARAPMGLYHTNILKIHGDLTNPENVVLTESDYARYFENRPAVSTLLRGLLLNRTFIFLGYSLRDPNLTIIIDEVSSLLKDARRPCYAVVFDASHEDIRMMNEKGINVLRLRGENNTDKSVFLWQFLDALQTKYFAPQGAWLAPDSMDFLPSNTTEKQIQALESVKHSLTDLANLIIDLKDVNSELVDFIFPFLSLGAKHGLTLNPDIWETIAKNYKNRDPPTESNLIISMASSIEALEQACGKGEQKYLDQVQHTQNKILTLHED